jgi:predicted HTH transcriptional regulator
MATGATQVWNKCTKAKLMEQFKVSASTAERDLLTLQQKGLIEFIGSPTNGHYQLCHKTTHAREITCQLVCK